ncbi:abortive infection family protein [Jeotgalicoccus meleagridis]
MLRNAYGDGHGKTKSFKSLPSRYARLAVGAAITVVYFLWETYEESKTDF